MRFEPHFKPIKHGLTSLFLMASLTGCATTEYITVVERALPPAHLLEDCKGPVPIRPKTNGELTEHLGEWRAALRNCNTDKAALRAWAEE